MTEHSPIPWEITNQGYLRAVEGSKFNFIELKSPWREGAFDESEKANANAEFIIRAVNSIEDVEAERDSLRRELEIVRAGRRVDDRFVGVPEKITQIALSQLWDLLGVENQTAAVQKLTALTSSLPLTE